MTTDVMMKLGPLTFAVETAAYDELEREQRWRWSEHRRFGAGSTLQYSGRDAETVRLSGRVYPHFRGGLGQIEAMRAAGDAGELHTLVDGRERVWGRFAIASLTERHTHVDGRGVAYRQDFDLELMGQAEEASR